MTAEERFEQIYGCEPENTAFCPYRVCPIGAHVDHNFGHVTGFAIDRGIRVVFRPEPDGTVELTSMQFDTAVKWNLRETPAVKQNDWADYLRGAAIELGKVRHIETGLRGVIEGTLPIGGLSSSAAVTISFLSALCMANGVHLTESEMVMAALHAENDYVGVSCGKLDQSCEVYGKKDHLLYLDPLDDSYEQIPAPANMKPYRFAIFFSGVERSLAGSRYNMRVDEARAAAYTLMAFADMEYGKFAQTTLRDIPREVYEKYRGQLPQVWQRRAAHYFGEVGRVTEGVEAWRKGDIETFGRLSFESGRSSIDLWETGSPELQTLYEIMTRTDGIYGGRFSGAGFKGCCFAMIDPAYEESIREKVEREYLAAFPALRGKYSMHVCGSADGVEL